MNKETQRLIEQSLELYTVPDGQQRVTELPKWPGLTFDIETEAGQAMLGKFVPHAVVGRWPCVL